jgi:hypothetical protein
MVRYHDCSVGELPEAIAMNLPRYPLLPATLLRRLAVDECCRSQRLGRFLLMDAPHEFTSLRDHADELFLAMATTEKAFKSS